MKQIEFTNHAEETFYQTVDDPRFFSEDQSLIFAALTDSLHLISFGDYLKRYVYRRAEITEPFDEVSPETYLSIITDSFRDTLTPGSFTETKTTLRNMVKNWLKQQTVSRQVVLILGFGLQMTDEDVNDFLTKALHEHTLSPKDPQEVICRYCYRHGLGYPHYERLLHAAGAQAGEASLSADMLDSTQRLNAAVSRMETETALVHYVASLQAQGASESQGSTASRCFRQLYASAQSLTAKMYEEMNQDSVSIMTGRLRESLERTDQLYEEQKQERIRRTAEKTKHFPPEDITPGDMEKVMCSAIPIGQSGTYLPMSRSALNHQFDGKRFSRKRLYALLSGQAVPTRFDLITLAFYNAALGIDSTQKPIVRYGAFLESVNAMLSQCSMGTLYITNPYECFILMCILTEDPLGTYADVWELSYLEESKS